jgi:hypothetical protein
VTTRRACRRVTPVGRQLKIDKGRYHA